MLISARPEDSIAKQTAQFSPTVLVPSAMENANDIRVYLKRRVVLWEFKNHEKAIESILEQSEGVFIWIRYQEAALREIGDNIERIKSLPKGIKQVYAGYFF